MASTQKVVTAEEKAEIRRKLKAKRKIIKIVAMVTWVLFVAAAIALYFAIKDFGFLPAKYLTAIKIALIVLGAFTFVLAFLPSINNFNKILQSTLCTILAVALLVGSILLPQYKGSLEKMFIEVPESGTMNINVYTLADSSVTDVKGLANKTVGIQSNLDADYQEYALKVINYELAGSEVVTVNEDDIYTAVDALYAGTVDAILLNEDYASIIADNSDYEDFKDKTKVVYTCMKQIDLGVDTAEIENITSQPFIVGIVGQDSWEYSGIEKTSGFRSDVNLLVVVNPNTHQVLMVTTPRDAYVYIYGWMSNGEDKLTHAPFATGIQGWVKSMNLLYGIDMNYYLRVNFSSLMDIVDAVGGITVDNPYEFTTEYYTTGLDEKTDKVTYSSYTFAQGPIELDGSHALAYCRERKGLSNGDQGRNQHQAIIMRAMINKVCSPAILSSAGALLRAVEGKFASNLTMKEVTALVQWQLDTMSSWELLAYSVTGRSGSGHSLLMGRDLSMVFLNQNSLNTAKGYINSVLNNEVIEIPE